MINSHLKSKVLEAKEQLLSRPETVCFERAILITEAYRAWEGEPLPLVRAKAFRHVLRNMTLDLRFNPVFAGNTSSQPRAWMLLPEYGIDVPVQALIENDRLQGFEFQFKRLPEDVAHYWDSRSFRSGSGIGHLIPDYGRVLTMGLGAMVQALDQENGIALSDGQWAYRNACIVAMEAVMEWAARYAMEAEREASHTADPQLRAMLLRVADACRQVPAKPSRNLFEALQSILLLHMAVHIEGHGYSVSLGCLDAILAPYYIAAEENKELLSAFLLKLAAVSTWGGHSKTQTITLGGRTPEGETGPSWLTMEFLEAMDELHLPDPQFFLRWHEDLSPEVKVKTTELLYNGMSMPMLVGDEKTVNGLIGAGVQPDDARSYGVIGCNELGVAGKLMANMEIVNDVQLLNDAVAAAADEKTGSSERFAELLRERMGSIYLSTSHSTREKMRKNAECVPTPFTSSLMSGCAEAGLDLHIGLEYELPNATEIGFTNAVNGWYAINKLVFEERNVTLEQLSEALRTNYKGYDWLLERIQELPKWGDDEDEVDRFAVEWVRLREEAVRETEERTGVRFIGSHVIRSLHHLFGSFTGASPDGRRSGEALADSIGPAGGVGKYGPTALLGSIMKLKPEVYWKGGYNLNITLPRTSSSNPEEVSKLLALIEVFFANGGQELQVNSLSSAQLRDAMEEPDKFPYIMVRIAGFNALFSSLSKVEQLEIIRRAEAAEAGV